MRIDSSAVTAKPAATEPALRHPVRGAATRVVDILRSYFVSPNEGARPLTFF
jgi:hypothetical protein